MGSGLTKASQLCKDFGKIDAQPALANLGFLGQAMVLAYEDKPHASNLLVMAVLLGKKPGPKTRPRGMHTLEELKIIMAMRLEVGELLNNADLLDRALMTAFLEPAKSNYSFMKAMLHESKKLPGLRGAALEYPLKKIIDDDCF